MKPQLSVFNFSAKNQSDDSIDIHVDGYIVDSPTLEMYKQYWGDNTSVSYKSFRESIPANIKTVNLYVNSGGGHVGDAMAMHDFLAELEGKGVTVNREGRGIVASAATYLIMGSNSRVSENCLFMIHEVSGFAYGDVTSMENQVKAMRKFNDLIVDFYARNTGLSTTVISNMMKAETWLNAEETKAKGFVKATGPKVELTNSIKEEHWNFQNRAMLSIYNSFISKTSNNEIMDSNKINETIKNGFNSLMESLGLKGKEGDKTVTDAFEGFSKSITDALKDIVVPDNETITKLITDGIAESIKNLGENESIKNAIKEATKDSLTKTELTNEMKKLTDSLIEKLGNKETPGGEAGGGKEKNTNTKRVKNRFSGAPYWEEN